jgi:predicted MPP superfamily phosphohydrolase
MKLTRRPFLRMAVTGILAASVPKLVFAETDSKTLTDYSFIQLTDTHVQDESGIERTRAVVEAINSFSLPYDSIIHTGDVSHGYGRPNSFLY